MIRSALTLSLLFVLVSAQDEFEENVETTFEVAEQETKFVTPEFYDAVKESEAKIETPEELAA